MHQVPGKNLSQKLCRHKVGIRNSSSSPVTHTYIWLRGVNGPWRWEGRTSVVLCDTLLPGSERIISYDVAWGSDLESAEKAGNRSKGIDRIWVSRRPRPVLDERRQRTATRSIYRPRREDLSSRALDIIAWHASQQDSVRMPQWNPIVSRADLAGTAQKTPSLFGGMYRLAPASPGFFEGRQYGNRPTQTRL
jgi:hypothetical protein